MKIKAKKPRPNTIFLYFCRFICSIEYIMAKEMKDIEIANPLYDVVFKQLMENNRVAAYFIESFIGEKIENLTLVTTEIPVLKWSKKYEKMNLTEEELERLKNHTVIRLDFAATIKTAGGDYKKVLIEIQKARDTDDVERFRQYLAENYKRKDSINKNNKSVKTHIPIITIYLLGFNLSETDVIAFRIGRSYYNLIEKTSMNVKVAFAELLTHDSYMVQLGRITGKMKTRMEKVLSVFEQRYFVDSKKKTTKKYPHTTEDQTVQLMLQILEHAAADPELRAEIEEEWISHDLMNKMVGDRDKKLKEKDKTIAKNEKTITNLKKARAEDKKTISQQGKTISQQGKTISQQDETITQQGEALKNLTNTVAQLQELLKKAGIVTGDE